MLASDFSDLSGAPQMVMRLQERIRQMQMIKMHFQIWTKYLDRRGWEDRLFLERDLAACEDELFFLMKAITTSQRKFDASSDSNALLKWSISARDIVWHLMQDSNEPLVEVQLKDMEYDRVDYSDGSHMNLTRVGKLLGLNLLPDATYPEIIAPYHSGERGHPQDGTSTDMIRVYWYMLEAIAGIPVMDRFEVDLFPMKLQLERDVGKRIFEYIFPGMDGESFANGDGDDGKTGLPATPMLESEDGDDESMNSSTSHLAVPNGDGDSASFSTRPGSLELRLRPTLTSNAHNSPRKTLTASSNESGHTFRLFRAGGTSKSLAKKSSRDSLRSGGLQRPPRTSTGQSSKDGRESHTSDGKNRPGSALCAARVRLTTKPKMI